MILSPLIRRALVRAEGRDLLGFLQGLVTCDMMQLLGSNNSLSGFYLSTKGRIYYDFLMFKSPKFSAAKQSCWIECERDYATELCVNFLRYKLRKKIVMNEDVETSTYVLHPKHNSAAMLMGAANLNGGDYFEIDGKVSVFSDPRLPSLGARVVAPRTLTQKDICDALVSSGIKEVEPAPDDTLYTERRLTFGIGEGADDFPSEQTNPLENNAAFLNSVSFDKGCYIGQELTARTHHTGQIRKRLMPFALDDATELKGASPLKCGDLLTCADGAAKPKTGPRSRLPDGRVRSTCGKYGLAMIRLASFHKSGGRFVWTGEAGDKVRFFSVRLCREEARYKVGEIRNDQHWLYVVGWRDYGRKLLGISAWDFILETSRSAHPLVVAF